MKPGQIDMRNDIESPDPWQNLAHAIVLQAVADYRMAEKQRDLEELERFFRSDWFSMLTKLDPQYLIAKLRSEKSIASPALGSPSEGACPAAPRCHCEASAHTGCGNPFSKTSAR